MGLRDAKQRAQRLAILENAFAFMRAHEGALPTVAELARACGISDATVFNYVGQRATLRSEWAHRCLADCGTAAEVDLGGGSLRRALRSSGRALRSRFEEAPEVWARVFAEASPVDPSVGRPGGVRPGDEHAVWVRLVSVARERGEVRADVDPSVQAGALVAAWLGALAREVRPIEEKAAGLDDEAWRRISATVELVVDGLRKRNERVRLSPEGGPGLSPTR